MNKSEAKQHAKSIVAGMLWGRCCPETSDVSDVTDNTEHQEKIIDEINKILDRLRKSLLPKTERR